MELNNRQRKVVEATEPYILCLASAASGKALINGSKIYTDNGPISIEKAQVGMKIFGEDGLLHTITGVFPQGELNEYEVVLSDRTVIKCCDEHIWTFQTESQRSKKSSQYITCTLKEIIEKYPLFKSARAANNFGDKEKECKRKNVFLPMTKPVEFTEKPLKIDPYTLGALLGDGCFTKSMFTNADQDVIDKVNCGLQKIGCQLKYKDRYDYYITSNYTTVYSDILKEYGLWKHLSEDKFIPDIYKYNSIDNRFNLLCGLIDTDGSCCGSSYDIVLKSKQLILDCQEICESLGLTATYSEKQAICTNSVSGRKNCGTVYRLRIKTSKLFPKLHTSLRREKQWKPTKVYSHRAIVEIRSTGKKVPMTCISVDNPTQLFLTDNFVVTHNTRTLTERIKYLIEVRKVNPSDIVAISFTNMAADEIKRRIGASCEGAYIGTVHGYANKICLANDIDTSRWIKDFNFDEIIKRAVQIPQSKYKKVKHILIDECQDLSPLEYNFLERIPADNRFYTGDNRQNIYQFKGCSDEYLVAMYYDKQYTKYFLTENYRNAPNIIDFAEGYIYNANPIGPPSQPVKTQDGAIEKCSFSEALDELEWSGNWGSWFILTRTNNELVEAQDLCNEREIPNVTFKKGDLDLLQLDALVASNKVKILTIHTAKGLENKNVIVTGARTYNEEERKICYVAATRAENNLYWCPAIAKRHKRGQGINRRAEAGRLFDKSGESIIF